MTPLDQKINEAADRIIATMSARDDADQAGREADARLRAALAGGLPWITPRYLRRQLQRLLNDADHYALLAEAAREGVRGEAGVAS